GHRQRALGRLLTDHVLIEDDLISVGIGRSERAVLVSPPSAGTSSRMMSLHSSMHSSQMKTDGPAISFFTSCWLLPQKEQYRTFSLEEPFLAAMDGCAVR